MTMRESLERTAELAAGTEDELIATLNRLLVVCNDAEDVYQTAARDVTLPAFRNVFLRYARQRSRYALELREEIRQLDGAPHERGSLLGALRTGWVDVKSALNGNDERSAVKTCVAAEQGWQARYAEALQQGLPIRVELLIRQQLSGMGDASAHLRSIAAALLLATSALR